MAIYRVTYKHRNLVQFYDVECGCASAARHYFLKISGLSNNNIIAIEKL